MTEERRLRELFRSERTRDEAEAPSFRAVFRRASPVERSIRIPLAVRLTAAAVVLVLAGVLVVRQRPLGPPRHLSSAGELLSSGRWMGPTDFLLATPGRDLLRSIPSIGVSTTLGNVSSESKKGIRT